MKFHVTIKGKPTSISVDDVLIDYFGAWLLDENPRLQPKAKEHYRVCKARMKDLCADPALPRKNVSQFIQAKIIKLIAAPHLEPIIEARGPRYVPPKREVFNSEPDPQKAAELMRQLSALVKK